MVTVTESITPYEIRAISYNVPSATRPGVTHTVVVTDDGMTCDCEAGHYKRLCWHRKAVQTGQVTSKPRVRIRPLEANVVTAAPTPSGNPSAWMWDPQA